MNKFNDSYQKLNLSNYEVLEHKELQEFIDDFCTYQRESQEFLSSSDTPSSSNMESLLSDRISAEKFENLWERYRSIEVIYNYQILIIYLMNNDNIGIVFCLA